MIDESEFAELGAFLDDLTTTREKILFLRRMGEIYQKLPVRWREKIARTLQLAGAMHAEQRIAELIEGLESMALTERELNRGQDKAAKD